MTSKRTNHANAKESTPFNQLRIDGFIETQYYRIVGEKGTVDVTEFTTAFATNSYYKSGAPIARHRDSDFFLEMKGQANVDFSCAFALSNHLVHRLSAICIGSIFIEQVCLLFDRL